MDTPPPSPENTGQGPQNALDPALLRLAADTLREALKGNGVKSEDIVLETHNEAFLEIPAVIVCTFQTKRATQRHAGKVTGPIPVQNAQDFQRLLTEDEKSLFQKPDIRDRIKETLLAQKDGGLALQKTLIPLPFLHKRFVYSESCKACRGQGKSLCTRCNGKGSEHCPRCYAAGVETCPTCGGRHTIPGSNGQNQLCLRCNGTGKIPCSQCHQSRKILCTACRGKAVILCVSCKGHGVNSVVEIIEQNINATFELDQTQCPARILPFLLSLKSNLRHHAHIAVAPEMLAEDPKILLPQKLILPFADYTLKLPTLEVSGILLGTQGALYDFPPFLETVMQQGIADLETAARDRQNTASLILRSARYKTLRTLIQATLHYGPSKALPIVLQKTPLGLSQATAHTLIQHTALSFQNIAGHSRGIGMALGLVLALSSGALYFVGVRPLLQPQIMALPHLPLTLDLLTVLACIALGKYVYSRTLKHAIRHALAPLFKKKA